MYLKYVENGIVIEEMTTENIEDVKKIFEEKRFFLNLKNNMETIRTMVKGETFKFYKDRKRSCHIEIEI